jgi:hypothetical protein
MFAEMPLDNRTVAKFATLTACLGFLKPPETRAATKRPIISSRAAVL